MDASAAPEPSDSSGDGLSDYERARLAQIRQNAATWASLETDEAYALRQEDAAHAASRAAEAEAVAAAAVAPRAHERSPASMRAALYRRKILGG